MAKINLLEETLQILRDNGKTPEDVIGVTLTEEHYDRPDEFFSGSWGDFVEEADFSYDSGYGGAEISGSLKIIGHDWWLERGEYDGSEWWEFKTRPSLQPSKPFYPKILRRPSY